MNINEIKELAIKCRVSMNAACSKAGMATSTPFRWENGTTPREGQPERLRRAIFQLAVNQDTVPPELQAHIPDGMIKEIEDPRTLARQLRTIADRIEGLQ